MFDWLPQAQPQRGLMLFGLVAALSIIVVVPLSLSDGSDGLRREIDAAVRDSRQSSTARTPPATPTPPTTPATTAPPPTATLPPPPQRPPIERTVGQTATDDGLELTVLSIREVRRIKRDPYYRTDFKAPRGGSLISARVTYVNHTKAPIDPFCGGNSAGLADRRGHVHETVQSLYSIQGNDAICGGNDTPPGARATVTLAFRLGRGERFGHLDLWNGKYVPDFDGKATRIRYTRP